MTTTELPSIDEVALGAFFEDIGKFMQRAFGSSRTMPAAVKARESDVLPPDGHGGYTHKHALWTDAFFEWMAERNLAFPSGVDANRVRDCAVYHHTPRTPLNWLSAVADHLSAGMDRASKDETGIATRNDKAWDAFRRVPLVGIFDGVELGLGEARPSRYALAELAAGAMFPEEFDASTLPSAYARLWQAFCEAFAGLCDGATTVDQFHEGLLALSERYTWAIPSSTIDQPDVSLHDHNRTVAAFAACLYRHHEKLGELADEGAIREKARLKFRMLTGDLSGIQSSLFRLRSERVKGVNRILRARSFLMGQIGEAGALMCRRAFGLPPYCLLQNAGGRFQLLVPEIADVETTVAGLRREIDAWMLDRYSGDLILNLALSSPLSGNDFNQKRFAETQRRISAGVEAAKQRPLASIVATARSTADRSVIRVDYPAEGACPTCGVRPVPADAAADPLDAIKRCPACGHEARLGQRVPGAVAVTWRDGTSSMEALPGGFELRVHSEEIDTVHDLGARQRVISGWRLRDRPDTGFPVADRFVANHVPHREVSDDDRGRYGDLSDEARDVEVGKAKMFEHLAADAREWNAREERWVGRAMLSVVKADVDRLGFVFGYGLGDRLSVGRSAQLSRMVDAFFTGFLDHLVRTEFPNTYTVYSGGDDLLLIAPWFDGIRLAKRLREEFRRFVGGNPNITLSAGIEFVSVDEPLNRAVLRAEHKLERAKNDGRDRATLVVDRSIPWTGGDGSLDWALDRAEWLSGLIREAVLPSTYLYKMLSLDNDRRRFQDHGDPMGATWMARWGYQLARFVERQGSRAPIDLARELNTLMCGKPSQMSASAGTDRVDHPPDPRIPITIAIYRNR